MTSINLSPSSTHDDLAIDISLSIIETINKEQLKIKFKLASIDDIHNKTKYEIKAKSDEIKGLLSKRIGRYAVVMPMLLLKHIWLVDGRTLVSLRKSYHVKNF